MYVYQSPEFRSKAQDSPVGYRIENLIKKIERVGRVSSHNVPYFPGRYGSRYLKHEEDDFRIVAELKIVDNVQVVYLHTIYEHDHDYTWFLGEINAKRFPFEADMDALREYVRLQEAEEYSRIKAAEAPKPLPQKFAGWLSRTEWNAKDWVIYEGHEWVSRFRKDEFKDRWEILCEIVEGVVSYSEAYGLSGDQSNQTCGEVIVSPVNDHQGIYLANKKDRYVLFSTHQVEIQLDDNGDSERGFNRLVIFLLAPFDHSPKKQEITKLILDAYPFLSNETNACLSFNDIARASSRVYHSYMPLSHELWEEIEKEEGVNLALSAEEERILFSLSSAGPKDYRLPIFINGRAGSGKSTILFYIFTDYCYRLFDPKNQNNIEQLGLEGFPLFLTYNKELLKVAKDRILRLLRTRLFIDDPRQLEELDKRLTPMLKPFREYLLQLLPDEDENEKFRDASKRITFHEFRQWFLSQSHYQDFKKYSADECWYVIRTYIKGYSLDGYLNTEEYDAIFYKDRIFPSDDYDKIFNNVWKSYIKHLKDYDLWDDQDLIRAVLNSGVEPDLEYTAIFCDEAQDFTKLELHFILQSSIFAQYDLSGYNKTISLPFAFAGDPLQTLNPTGFRWAKVQSIFHQEIIESVDPGRILALLIKPLDDLIYNYRSTEPIVESTNAIILVRNTLFDQDTKPQSHWGKGNVSFFPQKFILEQVDLKLLNQKIQDTIIIVPCDEGGEVDYIKGDKELSMLFPDITEENRPWNVFSAIGAKGLEFQRVILYKFGESCPSKIWYGDMSYGQKVEAEYFFNKLYVAATRAMMWLFVLESTDGIQNLWDQMNEQELISYRGSRKDSESWIVRPSTDTNPANIYTVQAIANGTEDGLKEIYETDPGKNAKELKEKGISAENPGNLRRARSFFQRLNDQEEADLCEAYALKFEQKLADAGKLFLKINRIDLARECFWEGELWSDLLQLRGEIRPEEVQIAQFMVSKKDDASLILEFTAFIEKCIDNNTLGKSVNKQWKNVLSEYRQRISALEKNVLSNDNWQLLGSVLEALSKLGFWDSQGATGKCYLNAGNYRMAVQIWEVSGATSNKDYCRAKARTLNYPGNLEWWDKAGDKDEIYKAWQGQGGLNKLQDLKEARLIGPILEERERFWDACLVYVKASDPDVRKIANMIGKIKIFTPKMVENRDEVKLLVSYLCTHEQWLTLLNLLEKIFIPIKESSEQTEIRCYVIQHLARASIQSELSNLEVVKRIYRDIVRPIKTDKNWRKYISLEIDFGPAVEKLGFDMSLRFYHDFIDFDMNPTERDFARSQWIFNAEKKVEYFKQKGEEVRDINFLRDLSQRKRSWGVPQQQSQPSPVNPRKNLTDEVLKTIGPVRGLPSDILINETTEGQIKFKIGHIEFTVHKVKKIVTMEDQELNRVRCDLTTLQVRSVEIDVISIDSPQGKVFSIPAWKLAGKIQNSNDQVVLELALIEINSTFTIEL